MDVKRPIILKRVLIITLILLNIGCDQISKKVVRNNIESHDYIPLIQDHFILTNIENKGAMLGFGENFSPILKVVLLQGLPLLVLLVLLHRTLTKKNMNKWMVLAFAFVIGGGLGNLIDRIILGSVTDFFQIRAGIFKTGIFNVADMAVTFGVILILLLNFSRTKKNDIATDDA